MSDQDSNSNTKAAGPSTSSSCQNRKRELDQLEIQSDSTPTPGVEPEVAEGKDSSHDGDGDGDGGVGVIGEGHRRVKPKLELESEPSVNGNKDKETEEDARKKKSAELKLKVMKNTVVMENISKRLSVRNLLDLRQTCPRWNQSFIPQIKKKHKKIQFTSGMVDGKSRNTDEFMELVRSSQDFPFTRYCFGADPPDDKDTCVRDCMNFSELVYEFGNTVTRFTASWEGHTDPPVVQLLKLRRIIFKARMPELKELSLKEPSFMTDGNHHHELPETGRELATSLPNLKRFSVTLWNSDRDAHPDFCQLVSDVIQWANGLEFLKIEDGLPNNKIVQAAIEGLLLRNSEQHIKSIVVTSYSCLKIDDLKKLIELARRKKNALQLNSFTADVNCFRGPVSDEKIEAIQLVHDFLLTQSKTLENLTLNCVYDDDGDNELCTRIPLMKRVKGLSINPGEVSLRVGYEGQEGLNALLSAFPALRQFSLSSCSAFMDCTELTSHPEVEEFTVSDCSYNFVGFTRFGIIFPSLTRLELKLHDWEGHPVNESDNGIISELTTIWRAWPSLIVVKMTGKFNLPNLDFDSFLTGVPPPYLGLGYMSKDYDKLAASFNVTLTSLRGILAQYKTMPGISDLKHLREVTIDIRSAQESEPAPGGSKLRLTNIGGYFGVALASSQLQRVSIHGEEPNQISEDCQAFIRKTFGPCAVIDL